MKKLVKLLSLILVLILSLTIVACKDDSSSQSGNNDGGEVKYVNPNVTNGDSVVYSFTKDSVSFTVTKSELYKFIKGYSGISKAVDLVDEYLLSDVLQTITTENQFYISRLNRFIYGTDNEYEIDMLNTEEKDKALQEFEYSKAVLGLKSAADVEAYIKLLAARDQYAYNYVLTESSSKKSDYYIEDADIESYYDESYKGTTNVLLSMFFSFQDYKAAVASKNYTIYNSQLCKTVGDALEPLTTEEVRDFAIYCHNISNGTSYGLSDIEGHSDYIMEYSVLDAISTELSNNIRAMEANSGKYYMVYPTTAEYGTVYILAYKFSDSNKVAYDRSAVLADLVSEYVRSNESIVSQIMCDLRADSSIEFSDIYLGYEYATDYDTEYVNETEGSNTVVVKVTKGQESKEITADDVYASVKNYAYYLSYIGGLKLAKFSPSFANLYGNETDLAKNASVRKVDFISELDSYLEESEGNYATDELALWAQYSFSDYQDVIDYYYFLNDSKNALVTDILFTENHEFTTDALVDVNNILTSFYNNYFSVTSYELAFFAGADLNKYQISDELKNAMDALVAYVQQDLNGLTKADDIKEALEDFVTEYNNTSCSIVSPTPRQSAIIICKRYYIFLNVVSNTTAFTNTDSTAEESLIAEYKSLYDQAIAASKKVAFSTQTVKLDNFERRFIVILTDDTQQISYKYADGTGTYSTLLENTLDAPTVNQLLAEMLSSVYSSIFSSETDAKDKYNCTYYPDAVPATSVLDFSAYVSFLTNKYLNSETVMANTCKTLSQGTTYASEFTELQGIFEYYRDNE